MKWRDAWNVLLGHSTPVSAVPVPVVVQAPGSSVKIEQPREVQIITPSIPTPDPSTLVRDTITAAATSRERLEQVFPADQEPFTRAVGEEMARNHAKRRRGRPPKNGRKRKAKAS